MSNTVGLNLVPRSRAAKAAWKAACGNMAEESTAIPLGLGDNIIGRAYFPGSNCLWLGIPSYAKVRFNLVPRCIETISYGVLSKKAPQQRINSRPSSECPEIRRFRQKFVLIFLYAIILERLLVPCREPLPVELVAPFRYSSIRPIASPERSKACCTR